jgi:hypothetical protein
LALPRLYDFRPTQATERPVKVNVAFAGVVVA